MFKSILALKRSGKSIKIHISEKEIICTVYGSIDDHEVVNTYALYKQKNEIEVTKTKEGIPIELVIIAIFYVSATGFKNTVNSLNNVIIHARIYEPESKIKKFITSIIYHALSKILTIRVYPIALEGNIMNKELRGAHKQLFLNKLFNTTIEIVTFERKEPDKFSIDLRKVATFGNYRKIFVDTEIIVDIHFINNEGSNIIDANVSSDIVKYKKIKNELSSLITSFKIKKIAVRKETARVSISNSGITLNIYGDKDSATLATSNSILNYSDGTSSISRSNDKNLAFNILGIFSVTSEDEDESIDNVQIITVYLDIFASLSDIATSAKFLILSVVSSVIEATKRSILSSEEVNAKVAADRINFLNLISFSNINSVSIVYKRLNEYISDLKISNSQDGKVININIPFSSTDNVNLGDDTTNVRANLEILKFDDRLKLIIDSE